VCVGVGSGSKGECHNAKLVFVVDADNGGGGGAYAYFVKGEVCPVVQSSGGGLCLECHLTGTIIRPLHKRARPGTGQTQTHTTSLLPLPGRATQSYILYTRVCLLTSGERG